MQKNREHNSKPHQRPHPDGLPPSPEAGTGRITCVCDFRDPLKQCPFHEAKAAHVINKMIGRQDHEPELYGENE